MTYSDSKEECKRQTKRVNAVEKRIAKKVKLKKNITMTKYSQKMDKIIKKKLPVSDTLIEMLEEAAKYNVTDDV